MCPDGKTVYYTDFQKPDKNLAGPSSYYKASGSESDVASEDAQLSNNIPRPTFGSEVDSSFAPESGSDATSISRRGSTSSSEGSDIAPPPKPWEEPRDEGFRTVDKPKRFFSVGRIFKTAWFEPGNEDTPARQPDVEWTERCDPYFGERPYAKFRWFVVVRKRLHHSLCLNITSFGGQGKQKMSKGRPMDYVVLHSAEIPPPEPYEEEGISRDPIAIIIEDEEQYISPLARLDCGRIYTVEDNLQVMKIGRVHPDCLPRLEEYFRESVL
ncbi:hypothetical protein B0T26DRAFT_775205 [Lasiosphaeria miniovina]|uniref:DUF6590 domain-containing protein n=1 Tax=Lasiosphaeria miniovina TaxID=1954250 RepID=A0AA40AK33_9PEZI|nr:uncharacterized protein B0T26DRAFT_775205 [Lasiosphaeria miniovina]KAK0717235.1 hypothetical protein B0T26DRAFT_775205 [Lasiosphaeria miniovina]